MERIEIPENLKKIHITFPPPPHSGRIVMTLEEIGKCYGQRRVLQGLDLTLENGERLLVAGPNGAGKTTLLRIIAGEDADYEGNKKFGAGVAPGYFSQDAAESLSGSETVEQYIEAEAPTYLIPRVRDMLGAFLFRGDDAYKPLSVLSGGEKSRLALLRMLLKPMNLLILDEPTNHLDLQSKDILLDCLRTFKGTIIFVSHDRGFMEALSTKTLELQAGKPRLFYGNYAYYLDRVEKESLGVIDKVEAGSFVSAGLRQPSAPIEDTPGSEPKPLDPLPKTILVKAGTEPPLSASERRELDKQRQTVTRRLERREAEILRELEALETEKSRFENELARPDVYSSGEKAKAVKLRLDETALALEAKSREWEAVAAELAKL